MSKTFQIALTISLFFCFTLVSSAQEDKGRAYYDFGVFAYEDGDYGDAEKNLKKALGFNPNNPFYNQYLGKTYLKMERYDEARSHFIKAWDLNPDIAGLKYDMAFLNYKTENYTRASELFEEIVKEEPENVLAHYHGGISLYKEKKYSKAVSFFMTASEISPTIKANGYYYAGICHLKMGDMGKAEELLKYVKDHADSESIREYALKWLRVIKTRKRELRPYRVNVKLGYQYDSNVRLEPLDEDIYADEDDFVTVGYFSGKYNLINRQDYVAGVGYSHYQRWHNDLEEYDLVGSILNLYGQYRKGPLTFSLSYLPHFYWIDSSRYIRRQQIKPEISWKITDSLLTRFSYSYYLNNHLRDDDRDGHTNELSLTTYYNLKSRGGYLYGGIGYEDKTASHPDRYYDQWKIKLGFSHKMPWDLELNINGKYYSQNYDHVDSFYLVQREDRKYIGSISLSRRLYYEWLSVVGEFSYTKNSSNIMDFEYKRKMAALSLTARF